MPKGIGLCMGCMNPLDEDGVCHYCSYTDDTPYLQSYLAPGTILDNRYIIGKMLSYNGEGASYICFDTVSKCKCVCREYMPDALCERERGSSKISVNPSCLAKYKTFMSEFVDMNKALSKMRNLNRISTAKDMFSENNTTYIILEYIEGVTLKKFLQSNTGFLKWEQVKKLFVPLFTTLSIVHNAGIIHRGISPENIIVTTDCELRLTGFCISSIRTSNTGLIPEFYSGYTAPEQYSSLEWQGTWTDVYALAAVLYRVLTGNVPLDGQTRTKNDTLAEACRINPQIPKHISDVLSQALEVKGKDRIQTVTELVAELFKKNTAHTSHPKGATQTIPIQHLPPKQKKDSAAKQNAKKKKRRSEILGWCILVVALAAAVFLLVELFSPSSQDSEQGDITMTTPANMNDTSEEDVSGTTVATPETTALDNSSPYGYGAIMPNVCNIDYNIVKERLGKNFIITAKYYYSNTEEKGVVKAQSIPAGSDYDPNKKHKIILKVCAGPEQVQVPDCYGKTKKEYLAILDSMGIKYKLESTQSNSVAANYIISTSIPAGKLINVKKGQILTVTVSLGSIPERQTQAATEATTENPPETQPPASTQNIQTQTE